MPGGNAPKKSDQVVYIGGATSRRITTEQWKAAGVTGQETLTWNKSLNGNRCAVGELSSEALDFLLQNHSREFVVAAEGEKAQLPVDQQSPDMNAPGDGENTPLPPSVPAPNGR